MVRGSVEETLNELLEKEAETLTQAARYERNEARQGYRSGHYDRNLTTTSGDVTLHVPRLKGVSFETAIIERYRRRESSVEEALIEMYLAGVSVRRVEDITEALWGSKVSPATISELNKKAYVHIEDWRNRPLQGGRYPYVYVDGIYLRRNWGGEYENVAILVAIAVNEDGFREVLGAAEGMKEDKASWINFFQWLRGRGLDGVKLIVGDKCMGMLEAVGEVFPDAKYQRCTMHFYRNVFSVVPKSKVKIVAKMLKAIHAQENKKASREKAKAVVTDGGSSGRRLHCRLTSFSRALQTFLRINLDSASVSERLLEMAAFYAWLNFTLTIDQQRASHSGGPLLIVSLFLTCPDRHDTGT